MAEVIVDLLLSHKVELPANRGISSSLVSTLRLLISSYQTFTMLTTPSTLIVVILVV